MNFIQNTWAEVKQDKLLGKVVRNSLHLFSSNSLSLVLSVVQGILAARLLGPAGYGLVAIIMGYASTVNGLFSFRMSEMIVRYGGEYLERDERDLTAALVKVASLTEAIISILAFLILVLTAGLATRFIAKTPEVEIYFIVYALGLLANFNIETSTGILQITNKIKLQGVINLIQTIITASVITAAYLMEGSLAIVLGAYLLGKIILGLGMFIIAQIHLRRAIQRSWWNASVKSLPAFKEMAKFSISSNLSASAILVFRESEILWVGFFLSSEAAGFYKVAYAIVRLLSVPANPLILTVYPELNRLIVQKTWPRLRDFLRKITVLSFGYNSILALGLLFFGKWVLQIYGEEYIVAYPAMVALLIGFVFNYTLFWNRPLLLSLGLPVFPLKAITVAGLTKIALTFPLVPRFGYVAQAVLLSCYYIASVGTIVWRGLKEIRLKEQS
ncbi:MAG: oligosaccharide flippase family protein [Anaerolineae bacterium]|nr:oligosaccharide flippase family protein [Anaerolineae bacterium]MDK1081284.1 oligosaccharide flippase family protein [Anaerolineae bacterium]MDK1117639.1 oligosaccharide flippase family protein [Anaerolineae bacterium]